MTWGTVRFNLEGVDLDEERLRRLSVWHDGRRNLH